MYRLTVKQSGKRQVLLQRVSDCISSGNHRSLDVSIDGGKGLAAKVLGEKPAQSAVKNSQRIATEDIPVPSDF